MRCDWKRYRSNQRCAVCGHKGWCLYKGALESPTSVLCARVAEGCARTRDGKPITAKDGMGWVHDIRADGFKPRRLVDRPKPPKPKHLDFAGIQIAARAAIRSPEELALLAQSLGVDVQSLQQLDIGWCRKYESVNFATGEVKTMGVSAWSFPMRAPEGHIIGLRFRNAKAAKWSACTSINGLFIPKGMMAGGPVLIVEGPTDTAAALTLGFDAIGRPSNTAGRELIVAWCRRQLPRRDIVIVRNNDPRGTHAEWLTRDATEKLVADLLATKAAASVRVICPPVKDLRTWLNAGATHDTIQRVIRIAPPRVRAMIRAPFKQPAMAKAG